MFFRKKVKRFDMIEKLKNRPDEMFIGPPGIFLWSTALCHGIVIPGDYTHLNDEEANHVLVESVKAGSYLVLEKA